MQKVHVRGDLLLRHDIAAIQEALEGCRVQHLPAPPVHVQDAELQQLAKGHPLRARLHFVARLGLGHGARELHAPRPGPCLDVHCAGLGRRAVRSNGGGLGPWACVGRLGQADARDVPRQQGIPQEDMVLPDDDDVGGQQQRAVLEVEGGTVVDKGLPVAVEDKVGDLRAHDLEADAQLHAPTHPHRRALDTGAPEDQARGHLLRALGRQGP
mmetsp:Transcript_24149/g.75976  ORF Transcript_24149/g.75976 Transcript_24149/m.75976 type:complete len:212 (+) Transcript_24149:314-949(+)